ncbi:4512_t:CDS:2, partial [Scutellospora calospora]
GRYIVPWRKEFKHEWRKLEKKTSNTKELYSTNLDQWTCTCLSYMKSRFFLCKHLVNSVGEVQRNGDYPIIATYEGEFVNPFCFQNPKVLEISMIRESIIEYEDDYAIEDNNADEDDEYAIEGDREQEIYNQSLDHLNNVLNKTKNMLEQSRSKSKGYLWLRNVYPNFKSLEKMIADIETLDNRCTMPRTSKDFNRNTLYWD